MPQLSDDLQSQIAFELGFANDLSKIQSYITVDFNNFIIGKITEICERLTVIEETRSASVGDTMAVKVGSLELSYPQHWKMLFFEGASLIDQLAEIIFGINATVFYTNRFASIVQSSCNTCKIESYQSMM